MMKKILFLDLETTGCLIKSNNHEIIQLGATVWHNHKEVAQFKLDMSPSDQCEYHMVNGYKCAATKAALHKQKRLPSFDGSLSFFRNWMETQVDKYNSKDKFVVVAYNADHEFKHIKNWFKKSNDKYMASYFRLPFFCLQAFSNLVLHNELHNLDKYSLKDIANYLGIKVDNQSYHDALYDAQLAAKVYWKLYFRFKQLAP